MEQNWDQLGLCHVWSQYFGNLKQTVGERLPDFQSRVTDQFLIQRFQFLPGLSTQCQHHSWKIEGAVVQDVLLILSISRASFWLEIDSDHLNVEIEELWTWIESFIAHYEGTEELCCRLFDPLGLVLSELLEDVEQGTVFNLVWS